MNGAIVTLGLLAVLASTLATTTNLLIARRFPGQDPRRDFYLATDRAYEIIGYRLVARVFYVEALVFWSLVLMLVLVKFFFGL